VNGLRGKVAIVIGGASGVGKATALRLGEEGTLVVVGDINEGGATTVAETIQAAGGSAQARKIDISDEDQVNDLVDFARRTFGRVDLLHNVAADLGDTLLADTDAETVPLDVFDRTIDVNLRGYLLSIRAVLPLMVEAGAGSIVNTSSLAADRALATGARVAYSVSKSGVHALTRHVTIRYGRQGVRCNTACLGLVLSEALRSTVPAERIARYVEQVPNTNPGEPAAIAAAVAFLLSDDARYINGQTINIDGGSSVKQ
jgi:NAD(P)-dependent dehydrogenase (short-subunit alcohol dehydrogenase family)